MPLSFSIRRTLEFTGADTGVGSGHHLPGRTKFQKLRQQLPERRRF